MSNEGLDYENFGVSKKNCADGKRMFASGVLCPTDVLAKPIGQVTSRPNVDTVIFAVKSLSV